jgi:hypothetical protein
VSPGGTTPSQINAPSHGEISIGAVVSAGTSNQLGNNFLKCGQRWLNPAVSEVISESGCDGTCKTGSDYQDEDGLR